MKNKSPRPTSKAAQIEAMTKQLSPAQRQVQAMAVKTIEGAGIEGAGGDEEHGGAVNRKSEPGLPGFPGPVDIPYAQHSF